jgi:hypothetical protein
MIGVDWGIRETAGGATTHRRPSGCRTAVVEKVSFW